MEHENFQQTDSLHAARVAIDAAMAKLADLNVRANRYLDSIEQGGESRLMGERLRAIELQQAELQATITSQTAELTSTPQSGVDFGALFVADVHAAVMNKEAKKERHRISTALARLVEKIVWEGAVLAAAQAKHAKKVADAIAKGKPIPERWDNTWLKITTKAGTQFVRAVPGDAVRRAPRRDKGIAR